MSFWVTAAVFCGHEDAEEAVYLLITPSPLKTGH